MEKKRGGSVAAERRSSPHRTIEIRFKQLSFGIQRIRARKQIYIFYYIQSNNGYTS